ncbi:MAG: hypothetical protein ABF449_05535 [Ethanoligenens sp.]
MESAIFKIDELSGQYTAKLVKQTLDAIPGITSVSLNQHTDHVAVDFDPAGASYQTIKDKLVQLGLGVTAESKPPEKHGSDKSGHNKKSAGAKEKHTNPLPSQHPNQNHNIKKEALGPNTKR